MKHDLPGAEQAYRAAIAMEPLDPQAQMNLASLLARQGKVDEARKRAQLALALFAPDQRAEKRRQFEGILAASGAPSGQ
jgi:Flp pilus assembly protein TadD